MSDITLQLGQRIRELRCARHMSQEELSFKSGISAAHLGQIERGLKSPTIHTVGKIATALGVPAAILFSSEQPEPLPQNTTMEKIVAQLNSMSEPEQQDILRIIRIFRGYQRKTGPKDEL